jgi:hypothetical protein
MPKGKACNKIPEKWKEKKIIRKGEAGRRILPLGALVIRESWFMCLYISPN